jgi:hypothetical protein
VIFIDAMAMSFWVHNIVTDDPAAVHALGDDVSVVVTLCW